MKYHVSLAGFTTNCNSVAEIKAWAEAKHAQFNLTGEVCKIWQAISFDKTSASYNAKPTAEIIVGV